MLGVSTADVRPWNVLAPCPPAVGELGDSDMRSRVWTLIAGAAWVSLDWPALLTALMAVGRSDIPGSRLAEGHVDALRILEQADREPVPGAMYGVWASRSRGGGLTARYDDDGAHLRLTGTVPFASGAGLIDRALVTAITDDGGSLLVDADVSEWPYDEHSWRTTAMAQSRSFTITVSDGEVPVADQVGPPGFYLDRPAFFPGGVGVAAVWVGAAARVADLLIGFLESGPPAGRELGPVAVGRLGQIRIELATMTAAIELAGRRLPVLLEQPGPHEAGPSDVRRADRRVVSTEVRAIVGAAVRRLLDTARTLAGPAGLAQQPGLGDAIADLDLYVRQQHADRDAEFLGNLRP